MLNEQTFDKLYAMKLIGMAEGFKEQLEQSSFRDLSFEERFGLLIDRQWVWKENKHPRYLSRFYCYLHDFILHKKSLDSNSMTHIMYD